MPTTTDDIPTWEETSDTPPAQAAVPKWEESFDSKDEAVRAGMADLSTRYGAGREHPAPSLFAPVGKAFQAVGEAVGHESRALELLESGELEQALPEFIGATNKQGLSPYEAFVKTQPAPVRVAAAAEKGITQTAPQLGLVAAGQAAGIPAAISAPLVFGATPQGFDLRQAAIAALVPYVAEGSGRLTLNVAKKLNIPHDVAGDLIAKKLGGAAGVTAMMSVDQAQRIMALPKEQRAAAADDAIGNTAAMAVLSLFGGRLPSKAQMDEYVGRLRSANPQPAPPGEQVAGKSQSAAATPTPPANVPPMAAPVPPAAAPATTETPDADLHEFKEGDSVAYEGTETNVFGTVVKTETGDRLDGGGVAPLHESWQPADEVQAKERRLPPGTDHTREDFDSLIEKPEHVPHELRERGWATIEKLQAHIKSLPEAASHDRARQIIQGITGSLARVARQNFSIAKGYKRADPTKAAEAEQRARDYLDRADALVRATGEQPGAQQYPAFLTDYWNNSATSPESEAGSAFTPERLKLAGISRDEAVKIINDAVARGVPNDFILDRSKYTATKLALRDIAEHPRPTEVAEQPDNQTNQATTGPEISSPPSREETGDRPGAAPPAAPNIEKGVSDKTPTGESQTLPNKKQRLIGHNHKGNPVYEDPRGVRSYVENGIRVSEPVEMIPTREGLQIATGERTKDFLPVDKPTEGEQSAASGQQRENAPAVDVREPAEPGAGAVSGEQAVAGIATGQPEGERVADANAPEGIPGRRGDGTRVGVSGPSERAGDQRQSAGTSDSGAAGANRGESGEPAAVETPTSPADQNHVLPKDADWIAAGEKSKARANLAAIQALKKLEAENRNPTPEEKTVLAQYVGWGGLPQVFDKGKAAYRGRNAYHMTEEQQTEFDNWEKNWGPLFDAVKQELTPEEWDSAAASILNAHYTSREVINGVWNAAKRLGFKGGKVLEPGAGVGNFIGLTPEDVRGRTKWTAVELDDVSGSILSKLYPQANVIRMGFEKARIPHNSMDLVIGNVPFAKDGPYDTRYPNFSLHNYFFARAMDLLKPGGVMAAITSDSTMDSPNSKKAREYLAERADLVGAIRLPNNAFAKNANTEVTTDILFFRKKDGRVYDGHPFIDAPETTGAKGEDLRYNIYYQEHPEMMLGRMGLEGTMYGPDQQALAAIPGRKLPEQLSEAVGKLPANVLGSKNPAETAASEEKEIAAQPNSKVGGLVMQNGKPVQVQADGTVETPDWASKPPKVNQAKHYIVVRDAAKDYIDAMLDPEKTDPEIDALRKRLNEAYDAYQKKFGWLNGRGSQFLDDDVDFPLALALEDEAEAKDKTKTYTKAKLLKERTIYPRVPPSHVETVQDGLEVSLNYAGKVDPDYIAKLTGQSADSVKDALRASKLAFENSTTGLWESRATYLSGFVKDKLREAQERLVDNPEYAANVAELEKVQPARVPFNQITVRLGATWVPPEIIQRFIQAALDLPAKVTFSGQTGDWHVTPGGNSYSARNIDTFGVHGWKGHELIEQALNLKNPIVTRTVSDGKGGTREERDPVASAEAGMKQEQLKKLWQDWLGKDAEAATILEQLFNDYFNGTVAPRFDAANWEHYPNASKDIKLRPHQKEVVSRMLQNSTLLAHAVGTGKTYAMITAAMEMKRMGLARKPMIVVQNATLEQFSAAFKRLYPTARILAPGARDRDAKNRNKTMSRIATGDWDCVVIPQSFVNMLPDDPAREASYIHQQIEELEEAKITAAYTEGKRSPKAKDLERAKKRLEEKLQAITDRAKDDVLKFEQLGVDALFVDEAHAYKKLVFQTQMDNIKGLDKGESQRALSMYMKTRWVQEKNNGRNVIFATGTPVSNTLAEAWNMMRFLRPDVLKKYHMERFDEFASTFGDRVTNLEMTAGGTWKPVTRFAKFTNGPELITAWRTVADVVLPEELNLPGMPRLKNGKRTAVVVPQSPQIKSYIQHLRNMLAAFEAMSGKEKRENSHIPLVVFGLAKKASLDIRMIDPSLPDDPKSKLNMAADRIHLIWKESAPVKGTQLVFADLYQDNPEAPRFNLYEEMKKKLVQRGIPETEVVIVTDKLKDRGREELFEKVKRGEVRVMIGSTERMGVGVNVQDRAIALHHLDAPLRPMDLEQRDGRVLRQGNQNPEVDIASYGVENTLDAALFQLNATKQKFINQILRGQIAGRDFEDAANETSLSYEEMMAAFSGDKRTMEKFGLENKVKQLEGLRSGHLEQIRGAKKKLSETESRYLPYQRQKLKEQESYAAKLAKEFPKDRDPVLVQDNKMTSGRKEVAAALEKTVKELIEEAKANAGKRIDVTKNPVSRIIRLTINGQPLSLQGAVPTDITGKALLDNAVTEWWPNDDRMARRAITTGGGLLVSLQSWAENEMAQPATTRRSIEAYEKDVRELRGFVQQPFDREKELDDSRARLSELMEELRKEGEEASKAALEKARAESDESDEEEPPPGEGLGPSMGAQTPASEISKSELRQLTDALHGLGGGSTPAKVFDFGRRLQSWKDNASAALYGLKLVGQQLLKALEGKPQWDEFKQVIGNRHLALSESAVNARKFVADAKKMVPNPILQEAISNWVDAGGDDNVLRLALEETKPQYRAGYERALKLTPPEIVLAKNLQNYFESRLEQAQAAGILEAGIENYIHRIYEKDSQWRRGILAELSSGIYTGRPSLARRRVYQYDYEAERAGEKPIKSFVQRVAAYDLALNKAMADRQAVKELMDVTMPDGRPMIDVGGHGEKVQGDDGSTKATLIKPQSKKKGGPLDNRADYRGYDHPALRKWKWVGNDDNGKPVLLQGDALVHPEAVAKIRALFQPSAIRASKLGRGALNMGATVKQTMLDLSGFHPVQIGVHAMEHRTFHAVREIDFTDPDVRGLIQHGLVVGETTGRELFDEGLAGSSLTRYVPGIGPRSVALKDWLFNSFIPRMKVATGLHALERNRQAFPNLTNDELYYLTANQMNAAFGELNYAMLGRSATMQDVLRLTLLAPDFFEARARFAGQAGTQYGGRPTRNQQGKWVMGEQGKALLLGAAALYVLARLINKLLDDQYHLEARNAFNVIYKGKAYSLRTVQGDIMHAATDLPGFLRSRLHPLYTRTLLEFLTGRDEFGRKRNAGQQSVDVAKTGVPISLRGLLSGREQSLMESLFNAMGVTEHRESPINQIYVKVQEWKNKNHVQGQPGEFIYDPDKDPYRNIRLAAEYGDVAAVRSELHRSGVSAEKARHHFQVWANASFAGSRANDEKFSKTLSADELKTLKAARAERKRINQAVQQAR